MDKKQIYKLINSSRFLKSVELQVQKFKANKGYGRWIAEYQRMDKQGLFKPENLKEQYIKILKDVSALQYIYWEAIHYIGMSALEETEDYYENCYCDIRVITGEIALDSNDEELIFLQREEAIQICNEMNEEAEEHLFTVYDSKANKPLDYI